MVIRIILIAALWAAFGFSHPARASQEFKSNNPDGGKYEFAHSYISALSYIKISRKNLRSSDDLEVMRSYVSALIKNNVELRIAKNYLNPYLQSPNPLIRKTADTFIAACLVDIAINDKEKEIWNQWFAVKSNNLGTRSNERAFLKAQEEFGIRRKENNRDIVKASGMLAKVLRSEVNANENGHILALTRKQRDKLLDLLDSFGKDVLDWGIKPGQDHLEASIAIIREILEDPVYTTLK